MPRAFLKAREPFSSYSHFIGAVLSGAGLFVLLVRLLFDSSVTGSLAAAAVVFCTPQAACTISPAAAKPSCGG